MTAPDATAPCCGLAKALGPGKLAELDAELRRPNHRSFRKLAVELGVRHNAVERHKKGCLRLGEPIGGKKVETIKIPETADLPPIRKRPRKGVRGASHVSHGTGDGTPAVPDGTGHGTAPADGTADNSATRAPAPASSTPAERRRNRVLEIVASLSDGTWDTPRDNVARRMREWGVSKTTVEEMVREATIGAVVDPESVRQRRAVSMGRWGWGVEQAKIAIEAGPKFPDTESKLLAAWAQMQTGWDKAAGVLDESAKVQVNIVAHPVFLATLESVFMALRPYAEANAAVRAAVRARLDVLRQSPAPMLDAGAADTIETTGESTGEAA